MRGLRLISASLAAAICLAAPVPLAASGAAAVKLRSVPPAPGGGAPVIRIRGARPVPGADATGAVDAPDIALPPPPAPPITIPSTPEADRPARQSADTGPAPAEAPTLDKALAVLNQAIDLLNLNDEASYRAAIPLYEQAYEMLKRFDGDDGLYAGYAARGLGIAHYLLSDLETSLFFLGEAADIFDDYPRNFDAIYMLGAVKEDIGITLQHLSRYEESLVVLEESRFLYTQSGSATPETIGNNWLNTGVGLEGLKRFDEAIAAYRLAIEGYTRGYGADSVEVGYAINNIAWVHRRQEKFEDAYAEFLQANQIIQNHEGSWAANTGKTRINLGIVAFELGKTDEAIRWVMQAMPFIAANRTQTLSDQRWAFELLERAFRKKGEVDRAIFFGKMAVNAQQEIRALNAGLSDSETKELRDEWRRLYTDLADLLISQGRISEAQAVLNMEKEQEVFEFLQRDGQADLRKTKALLSDAELDTEAKLQALAAIPVAAEQELQRIYALDDAGTATDDDLARMAVLEEALQQATDRFDAAVDDFLAQVDEASVQGYEAQFDSVGTYQDILADIETPAAILQIATLDDATHVFLTLPGVSSHHEVAISKGDLARLVFDALEAIERRDPAVQAPLDRLYDLLLAPVRDELDAAGVEVVMLNLDGFLRYVPFAALYDGRGYAVEHYAFATYSAAVPTQFRRGDRDADKTAGFGVTKAHAGFDALPGVKAEMEQIFDGGVLAGQTGLDEGFSVDALKKSLRGQPEIIHIASHFALQPGQEDDSFLLMGDGSHLTLASIRKERSLRFRGVDLLTLSACQTARGGDGAELDGFGATAMLSGASAVMASLWPVADEATPILMRAFYTGMVEGGLDKAAALREAQLAMLHAGSAAGAGADRGGTALPGKTVAAPKVGLDHPYYWSAFVLMGNWL